MPYKNRPTRTLANRPPVTPGRMFNAHFDRLEQQIVVIARKVTLKEVDSAVVVAKNKAPVRRVFTGGRATTGKLSRLQMARITRRMIRAEPTMAPYRISNRVQTHPNRKNTYARSWNLRELRSAGKSPEGLDTFHLLNAWQEEHRLNKEGRRALREARIVETPIEVDLGGQDRRVMMSARDVGHGAIHVEYGQNDNPVYHLGGNLRASIRFRQDSHEDIHYSVVAGGERAPYAKFMEFGTRHVAARPFLRPALKHVERRFAERMYSAMNQAFPGQVRRGR